MSLLLSVIFFFLGVLTLWEVPMGHPDRAVISMGFILLANLWLAAHHIISRLKK